MVGLAYGFKWAWAPLVDRLPLPVLSRLLGRRRAWLLLAQVTIVAGLIGMALTDPKVSLRAIVWCALLAAFAIQLWIKSEVKWKGRRSVTIVQMPES